MNHSIYLCIDLKSFYASVECVERGLDPMTTNLVVADPERSDTTICLAVSPALKKLGVPGRCRVFEIPKDLDYIMAEPRMQRYIDYAAAIYAIYLRYIAKEDIHVYSIDEAFLDVTQYLSLYRMTPHEMATFLMGQISKELGIRATCGIGTNLYLCKIALDILAKHAPDYIAELDEESYRRMLWDHRPLSDFWRIGRRTERRLAAYGIHTMREIAGAPEDLLYRLFGIDAELMIDHAWGREPVTIQAIKSYVPLSESLSEGQVLPRDYTFEEANLIVKEMMDRLCLKMTKRHIVTALIHLHIGYSGLDGGGNGNGSVSPSEHTRTAKILLPMASGLYQRITDRKKRIRRVTLTCSQLLTDDEWNAKCRQLSLFDQSNFGQSRDDEIQNAILEIHERFGANALLRCSDLEEAATTRERNSQIGGHKSGTQTKAVDVG